MEVEGNTMARAQAIAFLPLALLLNLAFSTNCVMAGETKAPSGACEAKCIEPHAACAESAKVIDTLQELANAVNKHDLTAIAEYLDDSVTTFDEGSKKLVVGKEAVLADLKTKLERFSLTGDHPLLSYTIVHPYAQVNGNTAVVTFTALREFGGTNPHKEKCNATDVFVKVNDKWKKLHYRGRWKKIS